MIQKSNSFSKSEYTVENVKSGELTKEERMSAYLDNGHSNTSYFRLKYNNKTVVLARVSRLDGSDLEKEFEGLTLPLKDYCNAGLDSSLNYNSIRDSFVDNYSCSLYIEYIVSFDIGKGFAKYLVNYLKSKYNRIWLYTLDDTIDFWISMGFESFADNIYAYSKDSY